MNTTQRTARAVSFSLVLPATLAIALTVTLSGCSGAQPSNTSPTAYALDALTSHVQHSGAAVIVTPASLSASMPSVEYKLGSNPGIRLSTLVATGTFTSPSPAKAVVDSEQPDAGGTSPAWTILHATFKVGSIVDASKQAADVTVGDSLPVELSLPADADLATAGKGLVDLGTVVVFLTGGFPGGSDVWDIANEGALLGTVDSNGTITMRVDQHADSNGRDSVAGIPIDVTTIADLTAKGETDRTILVDPNASPSS